MGTAWFKCRLKLQALGQELTLQIPHDVFSTQQIDEGTQFLLQSLEKNLADKKPQRILDMGCGYGALGLPVAAAYPEVKCELVDRDLLAVQYATLNARENNLSNVHAHGSLGYRHIESPSYNWILCNVPARIGRPFIQDLWGRGQKLLAEGGELRVVVIRDLGPVVEEIAQHERWPLREIARGPRHMIYALVASPAGSRAELPAEPIDLYARDRVKVGELELERPFDLGGDDPRRLAAGLPLLLDALPRRAPDTVLCFRCGYGALPLVARTRWPLAEVQAVDRDLLATDFTRRNAERLHLAGPLLKVFERVELVEKSEKFALIVGEISASAGEAVAEHEVQQLLWALAPDGQALLLCLEKLEMNWLQPLAERKGWPLTRLMARDGYAVLRLTGRKN